MTATRRFVSILAAGAGALALAAALSACGPLTPPAPAPTTSAPAPDPTTSAPSPSLSPTGTASPAPAPRAVEIPTDCEAMVSESIRTELADVPLNDPATGEQGLGPGDDRIRCFWTYPGSDATGVDVVVAKVTKADADTAMDRVKTQGGTCFPIGSATRCEFAGQSSQYPVEYGTTTYWRDGVLIETRWSNLELDGLTASIAHYIWGD